MSYEQVAMFRVRHKACVVWSRGGEHKMLGGQGKGYVWGGAHTVYQVYVEGAVCVVTVCFVCLWSTVMACYVVSQND